MPDDLTPGPALDRLVCERLGIEPTHPRSWWISGMDGEYRRGGYRSLNAAEYSAANSGGFVEERQPIYPPVSATGDGMLQVIAAMEAQGFTCRIRCQPGAVRQAIFHRRGDYDRTAEADTLPHTTALAALRALGKEPGE